MRVRIAAISAGTSAKRVEDDMSKAEQEGQQAAVVAAVAADAGSGR